MAWKFFKHKWEKVVAIIFLVIIGLVLILGFVVNQYWSPILAGKVKDVVLKSSDGLYKVNFSSAELNVLRGTIVIYNITLKPDTAVYNRERKLRLAPNNLIELHVKRLTLSHIHPFKLYFQHKLEIGEIVLNNPVLNVSYQLNHTRDTVLKDNRTAWQKISKSLRSIHVGNIILGDVQFKYDDYSGNKLAVSELKEMNSSASDLLIDSATQTDKSRLLYCKDIVAELNNYTAKTPSGLYTYKINSLKLSVSKSQLNINGLTLKPVNPGDFFNKSTHDRFTFHLDSMQLNNFDFLNYHKYRILTASTLVLNNGTVQITSNPNHHGDRSDKILTFPNAALDKMNMDLNIDTIVVRGINVIYNEYNPKSKQSGTITFNNTSGRFLNVTTNKAALQKNNTCIALLTSYFMNRGKLDLVFNFKLADKNNAFNYKGSMGQMDLKVINVATMPLTMLKINSGTESRFDFDIHANRTAARGRVALLYNNLKVSLLKADTNFDNLKRQTIASLYANLFIVKHNNPDDAGGQPRSFFVEYTREAETPFFKSLWETLLTGIKPCVGLDKKTLMSTLELINQQKSYKKDRKIKKAERIERRTERRKKRALKKLQKATEISTQ